jgi:hypothetical protein
MHLFLLELMGEILDALMPPSGRKSRKVAYRYALATFAAGVTALTKGRGIGAAIAAVGVRGGVTRKELKNFRDRLIRKRADILSYYFYESSVAAFAQKSTDEILAVLQKITVPNPY